MIHRKSGPFGVRKLIRLWAGAISCNVRGCKFSSFLGLFCNVHWHRIPGSTQHKMGMIAFGNPKVSIAVSRLAAATLELEDAVPGFVGNWHTMTTSA